MDSTPQYNARRKNRKSAGDLRVLSFIARYLQFRKRLPFAKPAPICGVQLQQADRRSTYRGAPDDKDSVALEMFIPSVLPRMKQPDELAAFRVNSAQVWTLVRIAVVAGESEVPAVVCSAMLASDDVLNVIGEERLRVLWQGST